MEQPTDPQDFVTHVQMPGERIHGTFKEGFHQVFAPDATDEEFDAGWEAAQARVAEKMKRITEAERQAAIHSRDIIIGRTAVR